MTTDERGHMKTVYLAGPIRGVDYEGAVSWRTDATRKLHDLGVKGLSPMRGKDYLKDVSGVLEGSQLISDGSFPEHPMSTGKGITTRDRYDVINCDVVLAYLKGADRISVGTAIEFGWADAFRKPVVMVDDPDGIHNHAMLNEIAGYKVGTLEEGLHIALVLLGVRQ